MPVSPGDDFDFEASFYNDLQRMRQQWIENGRNPLLPRGGNQLAGPGWCYIKNTTSSNLAFGDVLGIDQPIISLTNNAAEKYNGVRWKGVTPSTSTSHHGQYAILQEPATANAIVRAVLWGPTWVKLTITHVSDLYCEITNNTTNALTTGALGSSRILWKDTGTGSGKWGLIRVGEPSGEILVKNSTGGDYSAGSHSFDVLTGTPGSETTTGQTVTAYHFSTVKAGKKASCAILQKGNAYAAAQEQ